MSSPIGTRYSEHQSFHTLQKFIKNEPQKVHGGFALSQENVIYEAMRRTRNSGDSQDPRDLINILQLAWIFHHPDAKLCNFGLITLLFSILMS